MRREQEREKENSKDKNKHFGKEKKKRRSHLNGCVQKRANQFKSRFCKSATSRYYFSGILWKIFVTIQNGN